MTDVDEQVTHQVDLYGDGACRGNPGPGGWGVLLRCGDKDRELLGSELMTTNNRMELTAVIEGLRALKRPCEVRVYTDSRYVCDGMREWVTAWKARGWKTAQRQPVKNMDLWQALDAEQQKHQVSWHWIRGHAGHVENEYVDKLANLAIDRMQKDGSQ